MYLKATKDNVIFAVKNKIKSTEELLVDTGEPETILIGEVIASGPEVKSIFASEEEICAYKNRVAVLPWADDMFTFYVVKEENIYAIKGE